MEGLVDYTEALIRRYLATRDSSNETFAAWAHRVDEDHLQLEEPEPQLEEPQKETVS